MDLFGNEKYNFPTAYAEIMERVGQIDPIKYGLSRNFINGAVTYLSPYISRGIISTQFILSAVIERGYKPAEIQKFIQELAWRDYWQQVWLAKGDAINEDFKNKQVPVANTNCSNAIIAAQTGITAIDNAINTLYKTGYMHNHVRIYVAAIACNIGQSHWQLPAKWMYYNLLDADWASNALSWQWVAGANANKKYVANQENINKYCFTHQKDTFLDVPYAAFSNRPIPEVLKETSSLLLESPLPKNKAIVINESLPTYIYNFYNLDPIWDKTIAANRILLLEPSHFRQYPVAQKTIDFILKFSRENIAQVQIYVGEFNELVKNYSLKEIHYKEHPTSNHYVGMKTPRDWMFDVVGYYASFFQFWKKCQKQLKD